MHYTHWLRANDLQGLSIDLTYKQDKTSCPQCCGHSAPCSGTLKYGRTWLFYPGKEVSFKQMSEYIHIPLKLTISLNLEPCLSGKLERAISLSLFKGLFIYWLHWVFVPVRGLSLQDKGEQGLFFFAVHELWWLLLLQSMGYSHTGFSSCRFHAQ